MFLKTFARFAVGAFAAAVLAFAPNAATAQGGNPITIGFAMSLTGPLAANGKQALLGMQIWEEEINAKGGLLGRPVKLVYYDDQTNPSTIPGIYTKLLDVDKVDLVVGPYATNMAAPAMPVIMQQGKVFIMSQPTPNSPTTPAKARAPTRRSTASRSSMIAAIRRPPPISRRSCARSRLPIRTSWRSARTRSTPSAWCERSTS